MDLTDIRLNELPHHFDIALFFLGSFGVAFAAAFGIKKLSDAMRRTDRIEATRTAPATADTLSISGHPSGEKVAPATPDAANANVQSVDKRAA